MSWLAGQPSFPSPLACPLPRADDRKQLLLRQMEIARMRADARKAAKAAALSRYSPSRPRRAKSTRKLG